MIKRFVKLTFKAEHVPTFLKNFERSKSKIRAFEGCFSMELLRDKQNPNVFFTLSIWRSEDALNAYRHSKLFKGVWAKTKVLFDDKPEAWSMDSVDRANVIQ